MENKDYQRKWYLQNQEKQIQKTKEHKKQIREWFVEYKSKLSCESCGENHIACLDFHHTEPEKKRNIVSRLVQLSGSRKRIMEEIKKCIVLCSNCHRKKHYCAVA